MTNLPDRPEMRASDQDRDRVAAVLREAAGEGRLDFEELQERLSAVYAAKTHAELEPLTRDLPDITPSESPADPRIGGTPTSSVGIGIMGGFQRKGSWVVPRKFTSFAFMGGGQIDLREARFAEREVTIWSFALMGGTHIIVPEGAEVVVKGIGIMGGFGHPEAGRSLPGGPRIVIKGLALMGGVGIERKRRRKPKEDT